MYFIEPEDQKQIQCILDQISTAERNELEAEKKKLGLPHFLESVKMGAEQFPEMLNSLEKDVLEKDVKEIFERSTLEKWFKISSFDEVNTEEKFTSHFEEGYNLLIELQCLREIGQLNKLYKKYKEQHDCLKQAFIPMALT